MKYGVEPNRLFNGGDANMTIDFGFFPSPTAVALDNFVASAGAGAATLTWRTSLENNTLGFNVWRAAGSDRASAIKINSTLIPAASAQGGSYRFSDAAGEAGAHYWLEEVDLSGVSTWHGPALLNALAAQGAAQPAILAVQPAAPVSGDAQTSAAPATAADQARSTGDERAITQNAEQAQQPIASASVSAQAQTADAAPSAADAVAAAPVAQTTRVAQSAPSNKEPATGQAQATARAPVQQATETAVEAVSAAHLAGSISGPAASDSAAEAARTEMLRNNMIVLFASAAGFGLIAFAAFAATAVLFLARRTGR
jgi:hypothetical protein